MVIAYEPIWAIGTGVTATPADAEEMFATIRAELVEIAGPKGSDARIQYGGSVTPENAHAIISLPNVDGLLVGGASLDAARFLAIAAAAI